MIKQSKAKKPLLFEFLQGRTVAIAKVLCRYLLNEGKVSEVFLGCCLSLGLSHPHRLFFTLCVCVCVSLYACVVGGWAAEAQPFKEVGNGQHRGAGHQGEKAGGNVGVYPALAQRGVLCPEDSRHLWR